MSPASRHGAFASDLVLDLVQTALRLLPWPTEPGLRAIGRPDASSPVLLTCNYDLTVRRLTRALTGIDAWLLVAPSGGINVWCASSGGHLGTHQVVTALKTSGIADEVGHREVILPQLAATGVLALDVFRRSRWKVRFGPVDMHDIPEYLATRDKTDAMRRVRFPLRERLQMALMWGAPTALVVGGLAAWWAPTWAGPLLLLIAAMSIGVFTLYDKAGPRRRPLLLAASVLAATLSTWMAGGGGAALAAAVAAPALLTLLLTFDYAGSTPLEGGSHFEERKWRITLDEATFKGGVAAGRNDVAVDLLAVDEALERLAALDPQQARVVELRFFGGLTIEETASTLGVSPATIKRQWTVAKAWLRREVAEATMVTNAQDAGGGDDDQGR